MHGISITRLIATLGFTALSYMAIAVNAAQAATLTVANPGFESDRVTDGYYTINYITGWNLGAGGNGGVFNPSSWSYAGASSSNSGFEQAHGNNVAYTNSRPIEQTLGDVLTPNTVYELSVDVGNRLDDTFPPRGGFIALLAGSNVLATVDFDIPEEDSGNFSRVVLTYTSSNSSPLLGERLGIRLGSFAIAGPGGSGPEEGQINFDNVRLEATSSPVTAVPETSTFPGVLLMGAIAATARLKRKPLEQACDSTKI